MTNDPTEAEVEAVREAFFELKHAAYRLPGVSMALDEQFDELDDAIAAFLGCRGGGWLPIEQAPKDRAILLWILCGNSSRPVIGWWWGDKHNRTPRPYWTNSDERSLGITWCRTNPPTHFQYLPAPPNDTPGHDGGEDE